MHDRMLFLLTKLKDHEVKVTVKTGAQYSGVLIGADPRNNDIGATLKSVKLLKSGFGDTEEKSKEGEFVGGGKDKIMVFEQKDVVDIAAQNINLGVDTPTSSSQQNGISGGFKTDTDISGNAAHRERELHRWQSDSPANVVIGLEDGASGSWNQFEANERLFGVKSDFDENIYTTKLDRSHPEYQRRAAEAARIAAEIEAQSASGLNSHIAEERGIVVPDDSGMDEEDKYSGVQRPAMVTNNNPNRYMPPARRAPTGQPTVPGAPHDPAIISSQLARPETLQPRQAVQPSAQVASKTPDEIATKPKERPGLPEIISPMRTFPAGSHLSSKAVDTPAIEKEISINFKNFVSHEKERVKKKKADMVHRDRESKLRELKKFSESFTLKTAVPQDLVPILAKDKAKQAEIIEKARLGASKAASSGQSTPSAPTSSQPVALSTQTTVSPSGKVPPPHSFAARDPERYKRETSMLLQNFPKLNLSSGTGISHNVRRIQHDKSLPVRTPVPVPESRAQYSPTGPAAANTATHSGVSKRFNVNARPFEFKPNPSAAAFTPTNATSSPTSSAHTNVASRATSPSVFFGNKKPKAEKERPSIRDSFNPFERMKTSKSEVAKPETPIRKLYGNANDYIDKPWSTTPIWPTEEANKDKSYKTIFAKVELDPNSVHSPQAPHMIPPQPHHQQLPAHLPHINHPPHVPHQPHHGPMQQHLGMPPHYEQDHHLRQISTPSSVIPSPSLHNATVAPYQQSPVPHPSQIAMYPGAQGQMAQYGAPSGPQFRYYNGGFNQASGASPMIMHGPQPVPYPPGQMNGQFVHPQIYSPQQPQAYLNNGHPPPGSQGYPSPGRPATMMMHQGSSQGTPSGPQMMPPYGMQPGQNGPMYGAQVQPPQSELLPTGPPWLPQRSQSTVPFSSAVSSPRARYNHMSAAQPPAPAAPGTPLLSPALAAFASPTLAPASGYSSQPLQRSQTANKALDDSRGGGRGRGGKSYHGFNSNGGRGGRTHIIPAVPMNMPGRPQDNSLMDSYSNEGSMNTVSMMRGQPPPPPPHYYHGPQQGHYQPGNRGNVYAGPQHGQHAMPHPPAQSQMQPPQAPPQQQQHQGGEAGEDSK